MADSWYFRAYENAKIRTFVVAASNEIRACEIVQWAFPGTTMFFAADKRERRAGEHTCRDRLGATGKLCLAA